MIMADYTRISKQGYAVGPYYLSKKGKYSTILAIVKRDRDWVWVWNYNPTTGTWGQGHYMYDSRDEAIRDLKREYPRAINVNPRDIVALGSYFGDFGVYANRTMALERAYHISKSREEPIEVRSTSERLGIVSYGAIMTYTSPEGIFQLYADGRLKKLR